MVFENKVFRKTEWRNLNIAELRSLYSLPNIIINLKLRRLKWAGHVAAMEQSRKAYRISVRKLEGKRLTVLENKVFRKIF